MILKFLNCGGKRWITTKTNIYKQFLGNDFNIDAPKNYDGAEGNYIEM